MDLLSFFKKSAWPRCRLVLPEGEDERILSAARKSKDKKIADPFFVGNRKNIEKTARKLKIKISDMTIVDTSENPGKKYVKAYAKARKVSEKLAEKMLSNPLYLAALMVSMGEADGMVAGAATSSADVITAAEGIVGLKKGVSVPSSFFIMDIPGYEAGKDGLLLFADSSVNVDPSPGELADIAITTAHTAKELMKWTPRVAMLSFSTKGSAIHPRVDKVIKATKTANKKAPKLNIDGEFQGDSALVESTAKKKIRGNIGKVAGKANVLIFPDLDSGNISYKLVQVLAGASAYGPLLQGFRKPVSDLSRGAKTEDIVGVIAIVSSWAGRKK
ncbi:phosphate acetyltransferase [Candidatus Micrarchaeota archaeon]|nr:phosphate acetyltransferase [Candidatus Micrarchaeota archaeon]